MKTPRILDKHNQLEIVAKGRVSNDGAKRIKPDPRKPLAENMILGDYRIGKLIGLGSFSLVYKAVELKSRRDVIIKEYFPKRFAQRIDSARIVPFVGSKLLAFDEGLNQFRNEALALKSIKHPNVLNTHRFFRANDTVYLVSTNTNGRDLKWFLSSFRKPLDQELLYKVIMPILSALNFLHDSQLLHLDIKPANILLQPDGKSLLLDFGASRSMKKSERAKQRQVLTHGFASPELYDKRCVLGPWTDIYAVAATLYYSIAGKLPAKSKDNEVVSRLSIRRYAKDYNATFLRTINRSLLHNSSERFDSIDEFAAALLEGSKWASLVEYERDVMGFERPEPTIHYEEAELIGFAA